MSSISTTCGCDLAATGNRCVEGEQARIAASVATKLAVQLGTNDAWAVAWTALRSYSDHMLANLVMLEQLELV